mgnify:CR=1 FL=1
MKGKIPDIGDVLRTCDGYPPGDKTVLQSKWSKAQGFAVVLCLWEGQFVTWLYNVEEDYCISGYYDSETLDEALEYYNGR